MSFGLISTSLTGAHESLKNRRRIYYQYPTGAAQLMGLLSLLPEQETDKSDFGWWERRFPLQLTTTGTNGTSNTSTPFLNEDNTVIADGGTGITLMVDTVYRVTLSDTTEFKRTHVVEFRGLLLQSSISTTVSGTVTDVGTTYIKFRLDSTQTGVVNLNTSTPNNEGMTVAIIGTANQEGARSTNGIIVFPVNPTNYTQIFRAAFSLTRTALKAGLEFDKSGPYAMTAKENGLRHMIEMEKALFWGNKHSVTVADPTSGDLTPEKKLGGIRYFLQQWEMANSIYRNGNAGTSPAVTLNSDNNKRIIDLTNVGAGGNAQGSLTVDDFNLYMQRLFQQTNDKGWEKICFCGGKFLGVINRLFDKQVVRVTQVEEKSVNFKFIVHTLETLYGIVHFKVHPLFNADPSLQGSGMFLDLGNIKYRPLSDGDTLFLKGRQENDRDSRKDEWITEMGLELNFPESHMYMQNVLKAA